MDVKKITALYKTEIKKYIKGNDQDSHFLTELQKEEKYRPFTVDEIGVICMSYYRFRNKKTKDEYMGMLTGVIRKSAENESDIVCIGCFQGTLEELFEQYELMGENDEWQPFGVLENES